MPMKRADFEKLVKNEREQATRVLAEIIVEGQEVGELITHVIDLQSGMTTPLSQYSDDALLAEFNLYDEEED